MSEASSAVQKKKRPRRKRHILRKLLILLIVLVVMAGGALYAYESLRQKYTITYTGYTATTGSISNALSFSGSMALIDNTTHAAGGDGSVRAVYVAAGDAVKRGISCCACLRAKRSRRILTAGSIRSRSRRAIPSPPETPWCRWRISPT